MRKQKKKDLETYLNSFGYGKQIYCLTKKEKTNLFP